MQRCSRSVERDDDGEMHWQFAYLLHQLSLQALEKRKAERARKQAAAAAAAAASAAAATAQSGTSYSPAPALAAAAPLPALTEDQERTKVLEE
jgi:hypothetical protein